MRKYSKIIKNAVCAVSAVCLLCLSAAAANTNVANVSGFTTIRALIESALFLIGGGLVIFGVVNIGMSWQSEDSEKKTKGINTVIGGAIVLTGAGLVTVFLSGTAPTS